MGQKSQKIGDVMYGRHILKKISFLPPTSFQNLILKNIWACVSHFFLQHFNNTWDYIYCKRIAFPFTEYTTFGIYLKIIKVLRKQYLEKFYTWKHSHLSKLILLFFFNIFNKKMAPISAENFANGGASSPNPNSVENDKSNVIRFNVTKNELYRLDDGYKTLMRRQKGKEKFRFLLLFIYFFISLKKILHSSLRWLTYKVFTHENSPLNLFESKFQCRK